jgi:CHAT domain-containing protein/tetratricopeptide (TPR) repeat protein
MKWLFCTFFLTNLLTLFANAQENNYDKAVRTYRENKIDSSLYYINLSIDRQVQKSRIDSLVLAKVQKVLVVWHNNGLDSAFSLMDTILTLAETLPPKSVARVAAYSRMGQLFIQQHELDEADKYFVKGLAAINENEPPNRHYILLYNYIAVKNLLLGEYATARKYADDAYNMNLALEGKDGFTMSTLVQTRYYINSYDEKYEAALEDGKEFQRVMMIHFSKNHPGVGTMHNSLAIIYEMLRRYEEALFHRQKAVDIQQENYISGGDGFPLAAAYQNLGNLYQYINEPFLAQEYLQKGSQLLTKTYGDDGPGMINILLDLAVNKMKVGQMEEAGKIFERAYQLQLRHAPYNLSDLAYVETFYGDYYVLKQDYVAAKAWYQRALNNYKKGKSEHTELALKTKLDLAKILAIMGAKEQALELTKGIVQSFRTKYPAGNQSIAAKLGDISEIYLSAGELEQAYRYSDSVFTELLTGRPDWKQKIEWIQNLPFSYNVLVYINTRIGILMRMYQQNANKEQLIELLHLADQYKNFITGNLHAFRSQAALIDLADVNKQIFAQAMEACWILSEKGSQQQYVRNAFSFAESSKGLLLKLASNNMLVEQNIDENPVIQRDQWFRANIHTINLQYLNEDRKDSLLGVLSSAMESYRYFQDSLKQAGDNTLLLKNDITPATPEQIRSELLKKNETLVEYAITEQSIFLFVLTANDFKLKQIDKKVLERVTLLRNLYGLKPEEFTENAYALYKSLIQPAEQYFSSRKLLIVPDGELHYLNFEILLSDDKERSFAKMPYLIQKYELSYLLSATSAIQFSKMKNGRDVKKLALFTPVFSDEMKQNYFNRASDVLADESYRYLFRQPFALTGAVRIATLLPNDMYIEQDAEERIFKEKAGNYRILHLGTHAEVNDQSPLQSRFFLAKAMPDDTLNNDDGYLHAYEIYSMQLRAELAVLSACETGAGAWRNGEGVISLAHSFMHAGCPGVVMSLWKIDEKTSTDVIEKFYQYLAKGKSKSEALRRAKLDVINGEDESLAHPYYWAGLSLIGDTTPIYNNLSAYYSLIVVALLLLTGFLFYRRRVKSKR